MVHCCVPGCKNTHHHKNRGAKDEWGGNSSNEIRSFSLHDLPNDDRIEIRDLWVMAINRTSLPKDVAVCSDHFTEDCFDEKWEEYKRKYGPTKVKRKLKLDAIPTIFPGRIFMNEKVQQIKNNWKNKVLQKKLEMEKLRLDREYKDRFKFTQTECECKCKCKLRRKDFSQQVNFQFKFMEDIGVQFPVDVQEAVKEDHSYTHGKGKVICKETGKATATVTIGGITTLKTRSLAKDNIRKDNSSEILDENILPDFVLLQNQLKRSLEDDDTSIPTDLKLPRMETESVDTGNLKLLK